MIDVYLFNVVAFQLLIILHQYKTLQAKNIRKKTSYLEKGIYSGIWRKMR